MHPQPLVTVRDLQASSLWYQRLLACEGGHGPAGHERIFHRGQLVLQLRRLDQQPYANGVLLWFETDEFEAAIERAHELKAEILKAPHVNRTAGHRECWIKDPDGHVIVLASAYGDLG